MADNFPIKDSVGVTQTLVTRDIGSNVHVPMHGRYYQDRPDVTGALAAINNQVALNVANITGLVIAISTGAASGISGVFEYSLDSTDGTNGVWYQVTAQRSNSLDTFENGFTTLAATPLYTWNLPVAGVNWFRVRCTAWTSGSFNVRISPCDDLMFPSRTPVNVAVIGPVAHDGVAAGSPVRTGTKAVATMPVAVSATNDVADAISTMQGVPVITLDAVPAQRLRNSLALTLTTDVALFVAQGVGLRSHLTDLQISNTGAAVDLIIKDGTTEIWRLPLQPNSTIVFPGCRSPLMSTANTAMNITLSVAGTVRINAQGYTGV